MTGPRRPFAAFVVGPAGSGKSTVARQFATTTGAALLDKDAMSSRFVALVLELNGHRADDRESNGFYRETVMPLEYDALFRVSADILAAGLPVVIDAPFAGYLADPAFIQRSAAANEWPEVTKVAAQVRVPPEVIRERLRERGNPRDEWKLSHWDEFWDRFGRQEPAWRDVTTVPVANYPDPDLAGLLAAVS